MDSTSREEIKKGNTNGTDNESPGTKLPQEGVLSAPIGYLLTSDKTKRKALPYLAQAFS